MLEYKDHLSNNTKNKQRKQNVRASFNLVHMLLYYQNLSFIESQYVIVLILLNLKENPRGSIYVTRVRSEGIFYLLHHRGHALRTPMGP